MRSPQVASLIAVVALAVACDKTPTGVNGISPNGTASFAASSNGSHDFANGGFERANGFRTGFTAQATPQGANGHLSSTFDNGSGPTIVERYDVVCLAVNGNTAAIGLVPTDNPSDNSATPRVLVVYDSQQPGGDGDRYAFVLSPAVNNCGAFANPGNAVFATLNGNVHVNDDTP